MNTFQEQFKSQQEYWIAHPWQALLFVMFMIFTAMVGYEYHKSIWWAIVDFIFPIFAWIKWFFCHNVTMETIRGAFSWFFV